MLFISHLSVLKKMLLPPLHIKLGLMKNFVKAIDRNGGAFLFLKNKFPRLSEAKIKEGVYIGSQIRELMKDTTFKSVLNVQEATVWLSFKKVVTNFLRKY